MPVISRTERQSSVAATPQPYSSGDGYAAPGNALKQVGAVIGKVGEQVDEQEMFDTKMKVSEYTFKRSKEEDDRIANFDPAKHGDPQDFDRTVLSESEARDKEFLGQLKTPGSQRYAALALQQNRQALASRAQNARQSFVMQGNIGRIEAFSARAGSTIDGTTESIQRSLQAVDGAIDEVPGLTPRQRHLLRGKAADQMWKTWAQKATPEQMEATLKQFDDNVDRWRKSFDAEQPTGGAAVERQGEQAVVSAKTGAKFRVASPYADRFAGLIADLEAEGVEIKPDQSGGYAKRNIAGTNTPSRHSHGEAIDINWTENARGQRGEMAKRLGPEKLNEIARRHGMTWGGNWRDPDDMHFEIDRKAQPAPPVARRGITEGMRPPAGSTALTGTPSDETGGPGTLVTKRERLALPDRATMGDHAINEFMQVRPLVVKRLEEERARRAGLEWAAGVMEGRTEFNPNDAEGRKFIDQTIGQSDIGKKIFAGDPEALIIAGQISDRMKYVPKPVYDGLKGLTEHQDPRRQAMGWTAINNLYARNPNVFNTHGDDKALLQQAEYVQRLSRLHGMDKALKIIAAEKDPDAKIHKKAVEKDVEKFMKGYEGSAAESQIAKDMDEGWWPFSRPSVGYDQVQKSRAIADYRDMLKRHYEATGDDTKAKAYATSEFKQSYGVTMVMGERVMPYPPERFFPQVDGSHKYIEDDIKKEVGTYSPSAKMDTVRLISDGRTAQDAAQGKPSYKIRVEREDGRVEELPGRFVPDHKESQAKIKEKFDRARKGEPPLLSDDEIDAARRGQRVPRNF